MVVESTNRALCTYDEVGEVNLLQQFNPDADEYMARVLEIQSHETFQVNSLQQFNPMHIDTWQELLKFNLMKPANIFYKF